MRLAILAPRPNVHGPLPKLVPVLADVLRGRGCEVAILPWGRRAEGERLPAKLLGRPLDLVRARRAIVRGRFPVVVVNTHHDWLTLSRDIPLTRVIRGRGRVVVLQFHGSQSPRLLAPGSRVFKWATKRLLGSTDGLFVLSQEERREWQAFSPRARVFVVRNPLPEPPEPAVPAGEPRKGGEPATILCVSRLLEGKGVLELVRALPLVQAEVSCRLVLAGDGPEQGSARALAEDLGVSESVELPGYVVGDELARLYASAEVFALPTALSEGFPMVVMEAMAAGLPIVTTPSRGPADYLSEGRNALFVPPRDPHALARALIRLLVDVELRMKLSEANRVLTRAFAVDVVADEYLDALERVVAVSARQPLRRPPESAEEAG